MDSPVATVARRKETGSLNEEKIAMKNFALRLGSFNSINESDIVDESSTRREAKLLMSLHSFSSKPTGNEPEPVSSSESEVSYFSDSSTLRRDHFTFICPSLSLENSERSFDQSLSVEGYDHAVVARRRTDNKDKLSSTCPASLLGRTLKVDDRDALRLSADAMARNIRYSFQSAINWRIKVWIHVLSQSLVLKENVLIQKGVSESELKRLRETPEALLLVKLREIAKCIQVTSTGTMFRILESNSVESASCDPPSKRPKSGNGFVSMEGHYRYTVSFVLAMDCLVCLHTPAGFSEITLEVPGNIKGTFLNNVDAGVDKLQSVVVELDTEMLTAMLDKSARTIVRASMEAFSEISAIDSDVSYFEGASFETNLMKPMFAEATNIDLVASTATSNLTVDDMHAAVVTPRNQIKSSFDSICADKEKQEHSIFLPVTDVSNGKQPLIARRFSSQLNNIDVHSGYSTSVPRIQTSTDSRNTMSTLVSPNMLETSREYEATSGTCPSLPLLVAVACREMQSI